MLVWALCAVAFHAAPAQAAPMHELTGDWINPPATVATGEPVVAEWRLNINDDQAAPTNDPVDNVTATFSAGNGRFTEIPDLCLTDGVTPPSSISADGTTLTCNFGTVNMGTAIYLQTPVIADGPTGGEMTLGATYYDQAEDLAPIEIVNPFGMDIHWGTPAPGQINQGNDVYDMSFNWTLNADLGSDPGPQTIDYILTASNSNGLPMQVGANGCEPFDAGNTDGHPWSGGTHPPEQMAPFVGTCTLTQIGPDTFRLTLTGIDYSQTQVPLADSAGNVLPPDRVAIASGEIWLRLVGMTSATGVTLASDAPTYTSTTGLTDVDDPANNTSTKTVFVPGSWTSGWGRAYTGSGGTLADDSYRLPAGTEVLNATFDNFGTLQTLPADAPMGQCTVIDTRYSTFVSANDNPPKPNGVIEYYVGNDPTVDPNSASYDPNAFDCNSGGADVGGTGWTTTPPADLSTVKAVRTQYPFSDTQGTSGNRFNVRQTINPDVPPGTDVWTFHSYRNAGAWQNPQRDTDGTSDVTPTPGARYPYTTGGRDILRVITATPHILKSVDRATVTPGVPAVFTLEYAASGPGTMPPTVDGFQIVDTLPIGMTYVPGSASPEPVVTTGPAGEQVLTWTLDAVPTNTIHTLTYEAVADATIEPGTTLTNTATASIGGVTTEPTTATVTSSTNGYTQITKTPDQEFIPNPTGDGVGTGSWTVTLTSIDPTPQPFTDTIDILPYNGDGRGTSFNGTYTLADVIVPAGATVYYTSADPTTLVHDPAHGSNGSAGDPTGNTVGWTTTKPATVTAYRVIGPELLAGDTFVFQPVIATAGARSGDIYINKAIARAGHTELVMLTSAPITIGPFYAAALKKYVQDLDGVWRDANDVDDYPTFGVGDEARYRIVIENTGQSTLYNFDITDDTYAEGAFQVAELAGGESETHEFSVVLTEEDLCQVVNTATATVDPPDGGEPLVIPPDPAGRLLGDTTFDKAFVEMIDNGDGTYTVINDLIVTRHCNPGTYKLTDTLRYGEGTTIQSTDVSNTTPGDTATNGNWDGAGDPVVADGVPIEADTTHAYRTTTVVAVDHEAATAESSDCELGDGEDGTGFLNQATLEIDGQALDDEECQPFPPPITPDPVPVTN